MLTMFITFFILNSILIFSVNAWGPIGHSLVAQIAQSLLTNNSQNFVRNHLPWYTNGNLSMLSSWPDSILYSDSNPVDYLNWQWSKELHYVNTPDWRCNYDRNRDCNWTTSQNCVDGAIQNYTKRLANKTQDDIQRQEALKFLVHFIGDTHQPLHSGFTGDKGGNTINCTFFGKKENLHKIWDTGLIDHRITTDFHNNPSEYYNFLLNKLHTAYANNITQWSTCSSSDESQYLACSTAWINENMDLNCDYVYRDEDNKPMNTSEVYPLGVNYYNSRIVLLEQRLLQGGVRLGVVINRIVELQKHHHKKHDDDDDDKYCAGTLYFFVIILFEVLLLFFIVSYFLIRRKHSRQPLSKQPPEYYLSDTIKT